MAEVSHSAYLESVGIYYRVLFCTNQATSIIVGQNFASYLSKVCGQTVPLHHAGLLLTYIGDSTAGVRNRDYFARCLAALVSTVSPCSYSELGELHMRIGSLFKGNLPIKANEVVAWYEAQRPRTQEEQQQIRTLQLKLQQAPQSVGLSDGKVLASCHRYSASLGSATTAKTYELLLNSPFQSYLCNGLGSSDELILSDSFEALANIFMGCNLTDLQNSPAGSLLLGANMFAFVLRPDINSPLIMSHRAQALAALAQNVPEFVAYLAADNQSFAKLFNILERSSDLSGRYEIYLTFKYIFIRCKSIAHDHPHRALMSAVAAEAIIFISPQLASLTNNKLIEGALATIAEAVCLLNAQPNVVQILSNIFSIVGNDEQGLYWKPILTILMRSIEHRCFEVAEVAFRHSAFLQFLRRNIEDTNSRIHLLALETVYAAVKNPPLIKHILASEEIRSALTNVSSILLPCTSCMISDILRVLAESCSQSPPEFMSWVNWALTLDFFNAIAMLLRCATNGILFSVYYPEERVFPHFYILQNCMVVMLLLSDLAEKEEFGERFRLSLSAEIINSFRAAMTSLLSGPEVQCLGMLLREEIQVGQSGKLHLFTIIAKIYECIRDKTKKSELRNVAYLLRNEVHESLYRLIPKIELETNGVSIFVSFELRRGNGLVGPNIGSEPVKLHTKALAYPQLMKEIALKLKVSEHGLLLRTSANTTIKDGTNLQEILNDVYANHRVKPQFGVLVLVECIEPVMEPVGLSQQILIPVMQAYPPQPAYPPEPAYSFAPAARNPYMTYSHYPRQEAEYGPVGPNLGPSPLRCMRCKSYNCLPSGYCQNCQRFGSTRN